MFLLWKINAHEKQINRKNVFRKVLSKKYFRKKKTREIKNLEMPKQSKWSKYTVLGTRTVRKRAIG